MIRSSIRNKLIVFLLVATIVPISTSIIITYFFTKQTVSNESVISNSNLIHQANKNMMNYLNVIEQSSLSIYNNSTLYSIIENGDTDYLSRSEITRGVLGIANSVKEIRQVYLYMAKSERSLLISERNPVPSEGPPPKYTQANNAEVFMEPTHVSHDYGTGRLFYAPPSTVITLHRSIRNAITQKELGTLSIDFDLEVISSICEELYSQEQEELYILDEKGTIIYSADTASLGHVLNEQWVQHLISQNANSGSFEFKSKQFSGVHIYERMTAPYMNWTLVKRIPYESLYKNARELTIINAMIFSLFLIVVISATLYISFRFTAPIRNLLGISVKSRRAIWTLTFKRPAMMRLVFSLGASA